MFACLLVTGGPLPRASADVPLDATALDAALLDVAQQFSPRVAWIDPHVLVVDLQGLERLFGDARAIGERMRGALADRGLQGRVAIAATATAARLLAAARAGLTLVEAGGEQAALAALPIDLLQSVIAPGPQRPPDGAADSSRRFYRMSPVSDMLRARRRRDADPGRLATFRRWGLRTLGDLASLPAAELAARLGAEGPALQALARGEDCRPLVPLGPEERFEATLELEWPIEGLEPLSFVLGRLTEPVCTHLDRRGRAAARLHVDLRLVTREVWTRSLELPTPIKDPRTLRTLALLDLESHPPSGAIDAVTLRVDPTPARTLQHSLLERARPAPEQLSTLVARLSALMGESRVGAAATVDSHRPGAFRMTRFTGDSPASAVAAKPSRAGGVALRRLRRPVTATVQTEDGHPVRVRVRGPGLPGGEVATYAGPWRTSGEWWTGAVWDHDEWDLALDDGAICRLYRDRRTDHWYLDGLYD